MSERTQTQKKQGDQEKTRQLVSVVVPVYNEADILVKNLTLLRKELITLEREYGWEMIVVNDGSTDASGDAAKGFARTDPRVRVVHHSFNLRLGQALRTAFKNSLGDIVVVMDVDLSYSPEHISRMLVRMRETGAKIVIASPYMKGGRVSRVPRMRKWLSRWANRFLCFMATKDFFSDRLTNITGMVRAYDGEFIRNLNLWAMDVDVNPEIIQKAKILRARIVEVPAHLDWKVDKPSGKKLRKSSLRVLRSIIQNLVSGFMFRPFHFFVLPGLALFLLSLYPLAWTFIHTIQEYTRLADAGLSFDYRLSDAIGAAFSQSPHAFIVGGVVLLVAIQLISLGLLALQKKRYYMELFSLTSRLCLNRTDKNGYPVELINPVRRMY